MAQLKSRNIVLKEKFSVVWSMANSSGMGFELATARVVCISTTWDAFLSGKSEEIKKWRNKPFPLFRLCEVLYAGTLAKGKHVLSSNVPITRITNQVESDDEGVQDGPDDDFATRFDAQVQSKEMAILTKAFMGNLSDNNDDAVKLAIGILQDDFEFILDESEMLRAIEVVANPLKAKIFMKLKGSL
ncbi:hypothetical protein DYB32_010709, partial [Aphanomyces invadans]